MRSTGTQPVYVSRWTYTNKGLLLCKIKDKTDHSYWQNMNIDEAKNKQKNPSFLVLLRFRKISSGKTIRVRAVKMASDASTHLL